MKKTIRLTESELHGLIRECIEEILYESRQPLTENLNSDILRKLIQMHGPIRNVSNKRNQQPDLTQLTDDNLSIKLSPDGRSFRKVPVSNLGYDENGDELFPGYIKFQDGFTIETKPNAPMVNKDKLRQRDNLATQAGDYIHRPDNRDPIPDENNRRYAFYRAKYNRINRQRDDDKEFNRNFFIRRPFNRDEAHSDLFHLNGLKKDMNKCLHTKYYDDYRSKYDKAKEELNGKYTRPAYDHAAKLRKGEINPLVDDRFENGGKNPGPMKNYAGNDEKMGPAYFEDYM